MNIVLTNDDGFSSEGIIALKNALSKNHTVFVFAPDRNRSAISHGITMFNTLDIYEQDKNVWSCSGTPADCAILALKSGFLSVQPDLLISGINKGPNLGTDIVYSGTCAASREAVIDGFSSISVSLDYIKGALSSASSFSQKACERDFNLIATFIAGNLERLVSLSSVEKKTFLNINVPYLEPSFGENPLFYKGVKFTDILSTRKYKDSFSFKNEGKHTVSSFIDGALISSIEKESDTYLVKQGNIVLSSVCCEPAAMAVSSETKGSSGATESASGGYERGANGFVAVANCSSGATETASGAYERSSHVVDLDDMLDCIKDSL